MPSIFRRLLNGKKGSLAIEYALIASLIAVAAFSAITAVNAKPSHASAANITSTR